jgi:hypothetical protein
VTELPGFADALSRDGDADTSGVAAKETWAKRGVKNCPVRSLPRSFTRALLPKILVTMEGGIRRAVAPTND